MSSKHQQTGAATDKKVVETADPTVDDDNQSDSEYEYEYEEIEVEVDEDYEEEIVDKTGKVMISEVETIVPNDEKKKQETLVLKSDGTTEKLIHKAKASRTTVHQEKHVKQEKVETKMEKHEKRELHEKQVKQEKQEVQEKPDESEESDKPRLGRALTSQEESILLPLLQGLLAANGSDISNCKQENTPSKAKAEPNNDKNNRSDSLAERNDRNDPAQGSILDELSTALNRLQSSLLEEKEVVTDSRKRNTILTLVAWLKRVLQTSTNDNAEAQLFSLTELLPTELLLSKLMPQLGSNNDNEVSVQDERSPASSKRFSRQRNNRFNTVGVSKEELADARLFLQKKLLSENLATTATSTQQTVVEAKQTTLLGEIDDNRRKSLNLQNSNDLDKDIRTIFRESKGLFSKSVDASSPVESNPKNVFAATQTEPRAAFPAVASRPEQADNQIKSAFRRKTPSNQYNASRDAPTDSDDDESQSIQRKSSNTSINVTSKSKNKFALRKQQMKRANTIDIPKDQMDDTNSDQGFSDGYRNSYKHETVNNIHQSVQANYNTDADRNHLPQFHVKSTSDKKFHALLNKNAEENYTTWVNPHKTILPVESKQQVKANNWSSKFGNIKNSFEHHEDPLELPVSPRLNKKNNFIHAPTSPFKPVQSNKPPLIPNGVHHPQYNNNQSVQHKVAAIQSHDKVQSPVPKPQLRTHQSVPSYPDEQIHLHPSAQIRANDWQQNKYASVDSYMQNPVSPKLSTTSYNPLYVPINKQNSPSNGPYTSPLLNQMGPKPYAPFGSPQAPLSAPQAPQAPLVSPQTPQALPSPYAAQTPTSPQEFPAYTYTSTDYTQPSCVSTFAPEQPISPAIKNTSPIIKNTILPDTSYLKSQTPPKTMPPPLLGSTRLSKQMKTMDVYSSNEYLSEPNYYRSPQLFSPTYDNYATSHDSRRSSQEFMATSQIMKYPPVQTATVVNKSQRYDDEQQAQNLRSFLTTNGRNEKRHSDYSEKSISPFSETNFSHVNRTYVPPQEPVRNKPSNNFVSMENISTTKSNPPDQGAPIRLRNNTAFYGSHNALVSNPFSNQTNQEFTQTQSSQSKFLQKSTEKPQISAPVKLNSYGGQYVQPKVAPNLDFSKPTYGKKAVNGTQNNIIIKNNVTNLNRSHTITHQQRASNYEIKRKQSLPAKNSEYFDSELDNQNNASSFSNNYLPFGALKKSKSTHTLALLQQFESKGKSPEEPAPLPSYIKRPSFNSPEAEIKPKPIIKKTPQVNEPRPMQQVPVPMPVQMPVQPSGPIRPETPPHIASILSKSPSQTMPILPMSPPHTTPVFPKSPLQTTPVLPKSPLQTTPVHAMSPPQTTPVLPKSLPVSAPIRPETPPQRLEPPSITETPSSPLVEDGHIIFPGQTVETKRRVQHYAQTLNAILNRKSIVVDEDVDESVVKIDSGKGGLQRSKSGTLLSVPKQYESAIKKSEVSEKERTVAAYFSGNKSPQGLQRSSSQHSVLSSSSVRTVEEQKSSTVSPMQYNETRDSSISESQESSSRTTTTKSAHHLKILRKQQKSTSPNPLAKSQTLPSINLLDESNVDDAFDDLFASFVGHK